MKRHFLSCVFFASLFALPAHASGIEEARIGVDLANVGLHDLAETQFIAALEDEKLSSKDREKTFYNLGTAYLAKGRPDLALKAFDKALALNPNERRTQINRAESLRELRQHEEALAALEKVIAHAPATADAHYAKGLNLLALGRADQAELSFRAAAKQKTDPRYAVGLARALLGRKHNKEAVRVLSDTISRNKTMAPAYLYRADANIGLGKWERAKADLAKAIELAPNDPFVRAHYNSRRFGKIQAFFKTAKELNALSAPDAKAPVYMRLAKGLMIDAPDCSKQGWCRITFGHALAGYVKKSDLVAQ